MTKAEMEAIYQEYDDALAALHSIGACNILGIGTVERHRLQKAYYQASERFREASRVLGLASEETISDLPSTDTTKGS